MGTAEEQLDEAARIRDLYSIPLLDQGADEQFDRLTERVAEELGTPIALVSLVDVHRQWFRSRVGLEAEETERCHAFCSHTIQGDGPMVVEDATEDPRFKENPLVTGAPNIRFYAGVPVAAPSGRNLGTLCVIDDKPRTLDERAEGALSALGSVVEREIARVQALASDALTGLPNRSILFDAGERFVRHNEVCSVLTVRLLHLREINREHGHLSGDRVLIQTAVAIESAVRSSDIVTRHAGSTFAVVLPGADYESAMCIVAAIKSAVGAVRVGDLRPEIAIGAVTSEPGEPFPGLLKRAESELVLATARALGDDSRSGEDGLGRDSSQLSWAIDQLDAFASAAAHDLKAPVRRMGLLAQFTLEDFSDELPKEARENIEQIQRTSRRLSDMVDGLLHYARVGSEGREPEWVDTKAVIGELVELHVPARNFTVVLGDMEPMFVPRTPFQVVFRNLLSNAVKHHDRPEGRIEVRCSRSQERVTFEVTDDGPGIPEEQREQIFGAFKSSMGRKGNDSFGLGLAMVKTAVEAHGGSIEVASPDGGRGTTFRVHWPVLAEEVGAPLPADPEQRVRAADA